MIQIKSDVMKFSIITQRLRSVLREKEHFPCHEHTVTVEAERTKVSIRASEEQRSMKDQWKVMAELTTRNTFVGMCGGD